MPRTPPTHRRSNPRFVSLLTAVVTVLAVGQVALAQDDGAPLPEDADPDVVVLRVGDQERTLEQFAKRFEIAIRGTAAQQGMPLNDETRARFGSLAPQFLEQRGQQLALLQLADRRGIELSESDVDELVAQVRGDADGAGFADMLTASGIGDEQTLRTLLEENATIGALRESVAAEVEVAEDEVRAAYDELAGTQELPPFEEARPEVEASLVQQQVQARLTEMLDDTTIETFPDRLPYAAAPSIPSTP